VPLATIEKGGTWYRVADPDWVDPLDGSYSRAHGGRWNAPGSFDVLYLARDHHCARTYVLHKLEGLPYGPEDLKDDTAPQLVVIEVPDGLYADAISDDGLLQCGLPPSYPLDASGQPVPWDLCQPVGQRANDEGLDGVACRSASRKAANTDEELAHIPRASRAPLRAGTTKSFSDWFWS
jgi:hypothetical protein